MIESKTTISGDTPAPAAHDYSLTLTFKFTEFDKPADPKLATAMNNILADWNDGRYPLCVEMIQEGLYQVMKNASYHLNQQRAQEEYGREVVEISPNQQRARWSIEADKQPLNVPYIGDGIDARIERTT